VVASNPEIAGRVSSQSSCAALSFVCSNGFTDDHGHGTATAAIAAGQFNSNDMMSGVAPSATIISEKALNASGSGWDTDVANGIVKAVNSGADVISLSLTYIPTQAVIDAINTATNAGVTIVWAAGNASTTLNAGADTTGLSATALSHLIIVGSVNSANTLSSFSNTPGSGSARTASTSASYASLWLMAPGENIVAPGIQFGANSYASWSGTSMSTPEVAGALALLEATWPVLKTNGTATALLFTTATDLGASGVDSTYGNGLLNLTKAFQPVGSLSVTSVSGSSIVVGNGLSGGAATSAALGSMPGVKSLLSHYTAFDSFTRNFTVNLSGLITSRSSLPQAVAAQAAPVNAASQVLAGGGRLTVAFSDFSNYDVATAAPGLRLSNPTAPPPEASAFYLSMTSGSGSTVSVGRGLPSTASFANALWGEQGLAAYQSDSLGVSNALVSMAQGGVFATGGVNLTSRARLAAMWSETPTPSVWNLTPNDSVLRSNAVAVGLSYRLTERMAVGLTLSALAEKNGMLGSTYSIDGPLSLGREHNSSSAAVTWTYDLGGGRRIMVDGLLARTSGSSINSGLIASVTPVTERAYGASFVQADAFREGDRLSLWVAKPLKLISGSAMVLTASVDAKGLPVASYVNASLRPNGDETDVGVGYSLTMSGGARLSSGLTFQSQSYNIRGLDDVVARLSYDKRF
jgi:subtilisin family serine protease